MAMPEKTNSKKQRAGRKSREPIIELDTLDMPAPGRTDGETPWGWHLVLNLYGCDPEAIQSRAVIKKFVGDLCNVIEMRRFGQPVVVNFGDNPNVTGYSMFQLIETSNLAGHFANKWDSAYLDIFSCKQYDPRPAAEFCAKTFKARRAKGVFIHRG